VALLAEKRIYLSPPFIDGNEMKFIQEAFDTNWIAPLGPNVNNFEKEICAYVDGKYALALSSGTAAIHLALKHIGVQRGDYVFCSSLTFSGSCNPIMYEHAIPVFIDCEKDTWNMSPVALQKAFDWAIRENKMPKAVIIVDLYGQSADFDALLKICRRYQVPVIEDAAEALGATYGNKNCGTFGDYGILSFNGNKLITTSGGGMVLCDSKEAIDKMTFWATQAKEPALHYEHKEVGYNYRLSNISAGIGRGQLEKIDEKIATKKAIYNHYKMLLAELPVSMMPISEKGIPNYWLSVILLNEDCKTSYVDIIEALEKENIESRPLWKPMHLQPVFKGYEYFNDMEDVSKSLFERGLCLPSGCELDYVAQERIVQIIKACISAS